MVMLPNFVLSMDGLIALVPFSLPTGLRLTGQLFGTVVPMVWISHLSSIA
jgi:hypothetical protein